MAEEILPIFQEENIIREEVSGLHISNDGSWTEGDGADTEAIIRNFMILEQSIANLKILINGKADVSIINGDILAEKNNTQSFDSDGHCMSIMYECPNCHKKVSKLLANGYCSKSCAMKAKAERARSSINAAGEKTLDLLEEIQSKLSLLDMALNILTLIPQTLRDSVKLPDEYREYVILRIEILFLELKKVVNNLELSRNEKVMELLKKVKFGSIDDKLSILFAPIQSVIATIIALQQALNAAIAPILALLQTPTLGCLAPNGGHGFILTPKSVQHPMTTGKILVEIEPAINKINLMPAMINIIDTQKIDAIISAALPPIQEFEYFLDPTAFKVRYAFSKNNAPKVKKMIDILQLLVVTNLGECFPRYKHLQLTRIFYVLAILTGWGPVTQHIFGDFIFHGMI